MEIEWREHEMERESERNPILLLLSPSILLSGLEGKVDHVERVLRTKAHIGHVHSGLVPGVRMHVTNIYFRRRQSSSSPCA